MSQSSSNSNFQAGNQAQPSRRPLVLVEPTRHEREPANELDRVLVGGGLAQPQDDQSAGGASRLRNLANSAEISEESRDTPGSMQAEQQKADAFAPAKKAKKGKKGNNRSPDALSRVLGGPSGLLSPSGDDVSSSEDEVGRGDTYKVSNPVQVSNTSSSRHTGTRLERGTAASVDSSVGPPGPVGYAWASDQTDGDLNGSISESDASVASAATQVHHSVSESESGTDSDVETGMFLGRASLLPGSQARGHGPSHTIEMVSLTQFDKADGYHGAGGRGGRSRGGGARGAGHGSAWARRGGRRSSGRGRSQGVPMASASMRDKSGGSQHSGLAGSSTGRSVLPPRGGHRTTGIADAETMHKAECKERLERLLL